MKILHGQLSKLLIQCGIWALLYLCLSQWFNSPKQEQRRIQVKALAYLKSHSCTPLKKYTESRAYDYVTGSEIVKPARTRYSCEGLSDSIVVLDEDKK